MAAAVDKNAPGLRFVTFLAPEMYGVYKAIATHVGEKLGYSASLFVGGHEYDVFSRGDADFGFI